EFLSFKGKKGKRQTGDNEGPRVALAHPKISLPPRLPVFSLRSLLLGGGVAGVLLAEAIDTALRVHQAMLARVERVAGGTDVDLELGLCGTRFELIAAGAGHVHDLVLGVDAVFHCHSPEPHARKSAGGLKGTRNLISESGL